MKEAPSQTASWSLAMTLAAVGGLLGVVGVFLGWFDVTALRQTEIFGTELVGSETRAGTADITGLVVLAVGASVGVLAPAALLVGPGSLRRFAASFAVFGGIAMLGAAGFGLARASAVAEEAGVAVGNITAEGAGSLGLYVSAAAGAIAAIAGIVALRTRT